MRRGGAGCNQSTHLYLQARWVPQLCALGFKGARQMRTLSSQCHFLFTGCVKNQLTTAWIFKREHGGGEKERSRGSIRGFEVCLH